MHSKRPQAYTYYWLSSPKGHFCGFWPYVMTSWQKDKSWSMPSARRLIEKFCPRPFILAGQLRKACFLTKSFFLLADGKAFLYSHVEACPRNIQQSPVKKWCVSQNSAMWMYFHFSLNNCTWHIFYIFWHNDITHLKRKHFTPGSPLEMHPKYTITFCPILTFFK